MNLEQEVFEKFQVEELEQRYEMKKKAWLKPHDPEDIGCIVNTIT